MPLLPQTGLRIVARLMNRARRGFRRPGSRSWTVVGSVLVVAALAAGCDQLSARRHIQDGTSFYEDEKYEEAAKEFEAGLQIDPDLDIGQYNLGLTYWKMFRPGDPAPENKAYADKAVEHFQLWLKDNPHDTRHPAAGVRAVGQQRGVREGHLVLGARARGPAPGHRPAQPARRHQLQGRQVRETVNWYGALADVRAEGQGQGRRLHLDRPVRVRPPERYAKTVGEERIHVADLGAQALQKAAQLDPKNIEAENLQGALYNLPGAGPWPVLGRRGRPGHLVAPSEPRARS